MEFGAFPGRGNAGRQQVQQQDQQVQQQGEQVQQQDQQVQPQQVQQQQVLEPQRQQAVRKVAGTTKAPKYDADGGFDLYRARLESYLRQRDCWNVVLGTEGPDEQNAEHQRAYEERNLFARDALLFGLLPKDAKKVCKFVRVSEMWTSFERDKTRRDFANSIRIRAKLYGSKYVKGMKMDKYLEDLEDYRRQLENMNVPIDDAEMASIILTGVEGTHRNVVRTFNRDENPPDLERVLNTLRSEAEMDEAEDEHNGLSNKKKENGDKIIGAVKGRRPWQGKKQNQVGPGKKVQGGGKWKETRECHFCHKVGHLRANCRNWLAEQKKKADQSNDDDSEAGEQPNKGNSKKKKNRKIGFMGRWTKPSGTIGMVKRTCETETSTQIMACSSDEFTQEWMLDTGTDVHVCTSANSFQHELVEDDKYFEDWKGDSAKAEGIGLVQIRTLNVFDPDGPGFVLNLEETRYSPNGLVNLLSQELLELDGWIPSTPFTRNPADRVTYFTNDMYEGVKLAFKKRNGHYWLDVAPVLPAGTVCRMTSTPKENKLLLWHMRFAHQNVEAMRKMVQLKMVEGMDTLTLNDFKGRFRCIACQRAKQRRMAYKRQHGKRQKECYARLMSDVCHVGVLTPGGNLYFQLIQDEASRFKWCYLLEEKSEAPQNVMNLILRLEKEHSIKVFSCDQGKEFVNKALTAFLTLHGIELLTTNAYTPEENCLVEKLNGSLMSKVRAINEAAGLPYCLWGEVLGYVVEVDNMSATKALNGITPHEKLFGKKPVVRDLHVCGSVVFHFIPKKKRKTKLDMRSDPGIFLGYAKRSLGYRILDLCTGDLVERRDVVFHEDMAADPKYVRDLINNRYFSTENELPEHIDFVSLPVSRVHLPLDEFKDWDKDDDSLSSNMDNDDDDEYDDTDDGMTEAFVDDEVEEDGSSSSGDSSDNDSDSDFSGSNVEAMEDDVTAHPSGSDIEIDDNPTPSRGEHTTDASTSGSAGTSGSASASRSTSTNRSTAHSSADLDTAARPLRRSNRVRRPNSRYDSRTFVLAQTLIQCMMIATVCDLLNPTSVQEAFASEHAAQWKRAMDVEYDSLMQNQTWVLVPRPKPTRDKPINILSSLWVLALKRNERGEIERHKARLAIKGYRQKYGLDYLETYSPVVRIESVLLVLLLALLLGLECRHVDFVTAFLNGVLQGVEIYMEQPEGYDDGTGRVCKLLKGLYGLKQASRIWNNTLHKHLVDIGFKKCTFDAGVYYKMGDHNKIFLTVYVDDIVIAADPRDIKVVVDALGSKFKLKDLGRVKHLLGMEINYVPGKILCISQTAYVERMLKKFGLADAKSVRSPQMHNEPTLRVETDPKLINDPGLPFREMVGSLQYLVHCTRPDLANAVRTLGRYGSAYTKQNFRQAQRVMRYLRDTKNIGLVYRYEDIGEDGVKLEAFADADHAGCPETSRSVSGWALRLNGNVWHWQSKKQSTVADDTCAAELIAAHKCTKEIKWAQLMLKELGIKQEAVATLYCDNQSTIKEVENNGNSQGQKHLAKKTRSIAEWVDRGLLEIVYVPSAKNIADIFTKALGPCVFERLREQLNLEDVQKAMTRVVATMAKESDCESDVEMSEE